MFDFGVALGEAEGQLSRDIDLGNLFLASWERTRLVPCFWRTVYASDLMNRPIPYHYHLTCPVCYEKVSFLDDVSVLESGSSIALYWLGAVFFEGRVYLVLFNRHQANRLYTIAYERLGKSFCFVIEEDVDGRVVPVFHEGKLVEADVVSARPALRYEQNFLCWLQGNLPTLKSFNTYGPFQLFWQEAEEFGFYFVPYFFHWVEECPSTGIMVLSKLYQQHGLLAFTKIASALSKE